MKGKFVFIGILAMLFLILGVPAIVLASKGNLDDYTAYIKALEYGLEGLKAYFEFIKDMFTIVIS